MSFWNPRLTIQQMNPALSILTQSFPMVLFMQTPKCNISGFTLLHFSAQALGEYIFPEQI